MSEWACLENRTHPDVPCCTACVATELRRPPTGYWFCEEAVAREGERTGEWFIHEGQFLAHESDLCIVVPSRDLAERIVTEHNKCLPSYLPCPTDDWCAGTYCPSCGCCEHSWAPCAGGCRDSFCACALRS